LDVPPDAFVVGCVAAVKKHHKRIDCLIREFHQRTVGCPPPHAFLLLAGARTDESNELVQLAETLIPGRFRILLDHPRDQMPDLYRAMDIFVLPSLFEMMPIAVLEALASGVPCIVNRHPVLEWMVGVEGQAKDGTLDHRPWTLDGGLRTGNIGGNVAMQGKASSVLKDNGQEADAMNDSGGGLLNPPKSRVYGLTSKALSSSLCPPAGMAIDMSREGELAAVLAGITAEWLTECGRHARERAVRMFSKEAVIGQYVAYYARVMGGTAG
jgi:glycosyltransferase involved in cell wall biosynthesis